MPTTLVAVAHGSRDPRSAATITRLVSKVRLLRPDLDVRAAFLDLSAPRLTDVLSSLPGESVVVPLLLGRAYHARVDIPAMIATARRPALVADVLGPDERLESIALQRLRAANAPLDDHRLGVVLAAAGSSHAPANALVSTVAQRWSARYPWAGAIAAFASATGPDVPTAIRQLKAQGARRIAVASWFLAPGQLPDRVAAQALASDRLAVVAEPLGVHSELALLVADRYENALSRADWLQYA